MKCLKRYRIPLRVPVYRVDRPPVTPFPPHDAMFVAITTQMANLHKAFLAHWVDAEIRKYGAPPIIFIDEAHTSSEANDWGDSVEVLAAAGASTLFMK